MKNKMLALLLCVSVFVAPMTVRAGREGRENAAIGIAAALGTVSVLNQILNPQPTVIVQHSAPVETVVYTEPTVVYTTPSVVYTAPVYRQYDYGFTPVFRHIYRHHRYYDYRPSYHHHHHRHHYHHRPHHGGKHHHHGGGRSHRRR